MSTSYFSLCSIATISFLSIASAVGGSPAQTVFDQKAQRTEVPASSYQPESENLFGPKGVYLSLVSFAVTGAAGSVAGTVIHESAEGLEAKLSITFLPSQQTGLAGDGLITFTFSAVPNASNGPILLPFYPVQPPPRQPPTISNSQPGYKHELPEVKSPEKRKVYKLSRDPPSYRPFVKWHGFRIS